MTEITSKIEKIPSTSTSSGVGSLGETEEEKAKRLLYCSLCKVAVNSASQLEAHNSGKIELFRWLAEEKARNSMNLLTIK